MRQLKITRSITSRDSRSLEKYLQDISKIGMITPEQETELARRIREGDQVALQRLVTANLRFVVSVAKQYQGKGITLTDLINEGNLGLVKAAQRFDETRGFKFISYAVWWIRQSIMQAIAEHSRMVRLPMNQLGTLNKINKAFAKLEQEYDRAPTEDEIATLLDLPEYKVAKAMRASVRHTSLDAPLTSDTETTIGDMVAGTAGPMPEEKAYEEDLKVTLSDMLNDLPRQENEVIRKLFGIGGTRQRSANEVAMEMQVTKERIRQIKENALRRLRRSRSTDDLKPYLG